MNVKPLNLTCGVTPPPSYSGGSPKTPATIDAGSPTLLAQAGPTSVFYDVPSVINNPLACNLSDPGEIPAERIEDFKKFSEAQIHKVLYEKQDENPPIRRLLELLSKEKFPQRRAKFVSMLGEDYLVVWLFGRGTGLSNAAIGQRIRNALPAGLADNARVKELLPGENILAQAASFIKQSSEEFAVLRREFWPPQLALVLSSELENPDFANQLNKILPDNRPYSTHWQNESDVRKKEYLALKQLYAQYLKDKNSFSLFVGENFYRQAMFEKSLGTISDNSEYKATLSRAKEFIGRLASEKTIPKNLTAGNLSREQKKYIPYKVYAYSTARDLRKHLAWANLWMGNILMQEAEEIKNPNSKKEVKAKLAKLRKAAEYIRNTAPLDGIPLVEARRLLADNYIQQAYLQKNLGNDKEFIELFKKALCHLKYIEGWRDSYIQMIGERGVLPRWLANISASVKLTKAKLVMTLSGEINQKPVRDLIRNEIAQEDWSKLESGTDKRHILSVQRKLLEKSAQTLGLYINRQTSDAFYDYKSGGTKISIPLFKEQEIMDLRVTLAENLARRAFIAKELGEEGYAELLKKAVEENLKPIFDATSKANPLSRSLANLWLAKITFFEAANQNLKDETKRILGTAEKYARNALESRKMRDTLASYAHQTLGEILSLQEKLEEAKEHYKKAVGYYPKNYEAQAGLADILSQQGKHKDAIAKYNEIKSNAEATDHLILDRVRLGLAEAQMRQGENYHEDTIQNLETILLGKDYKSGLFATEPAGSFLIPRAIDALIEAYSTNEDLHNRIILILGKILSLEIPVSEPKSLAEAAQALRQKLFPQGRPIISSRFQAKLYLKLAEAYSWRKNFPKATEILKSGIPKALKDLIKNDYELNAAYRLLDAEIEMRSTRKADPILAKGLEELIFQTRDPDLISRFILDKTEAHSYADNFQEIIKTVKHYLTPSRYAQIKKIFLEKGRSISLAKFTLTLKKKSADALFWDKQYEASLKELDDDHLFKEAEEIKGKEGLKDFAIYLQAQIQVTRGDIYLSTKEYAAANASFRAAIDSIKNIEKKSNKVIVTWADALIGLGEVHRYGGDFKNPAASLAFYNKAEAIIDAKPLPKESEERFRLLARIYLGKAKLAEMQGNLTEALSLIKKAAKHLDKIVAPPANLKSEIDNMLNDRARDRGVSATSTVGYFCGADGRCETQLVFSAVLPFQYISEALKNWFKLDAPTLNWLQLTFNEQVDFGPGSHRSRSYLGFNLIGENLIPKSSTSLSTQFRLKGVAGDSGEDIRFTRVPAYKFVATYWHKYVTADAAFNFDNYNFKPSKLDTRYVSAMFNFAWSDSKWLRGLRLGGRYYGSHFTFQGDYRPQESLGFGPRYEVKVTDWWNLQLSLLGVVYSSGPNWKPGLEIGGGSTFNIGRHFNLFLNVNRQQNAEYPITFFWAGAGFAF